MPHSDGSAEEGEHTAASEGPQRRGPEPQPDNEPGRCETPGGPARDHPAAAQQDRSSGGVGRRGFIAGVGLSGTGALLGAQDAAAQDAAPLDAPGAGTETTDAAAHGGPPHPAGTPRPAADHGGQPPGMPGPEQLSQRTLLLKPDLVLLPDGPARDHAVLVRNGTFQDTGPADDVTARHPDVEPLELPGHLLMPGFVDAHHHLTQSFGKAQSFGQPSEIFKTIWEPLEHSLDEDTAHLAAKLAALEALRGGFTTVADAGTRAPVNLEAVASGAEQAGIRCVLAKVVSDGKGGAEHLGRWDSHPLIHPSLAVPVPEDATDHILKRTADQCAEANAVFQIHVNEHLAAVERSLKQQGRRPIEHLHHVGALTSHTLGAHATLTTPHELRLLADSGAAVSYNPVASAWKGNAVAQADTMRAMNVRFGTGTDGTRGDGFRLVDAAETAQRLTTGLATGDSVVGAGHTWLEHATTGSADALQLGRRTGRIATGAAADFLLVDLNVPELTPSWDPLWELVRLANRDQITAVHVHGRLRLWQGWPTDWDGRALVRQAAETGREVVRKARLRRVTPREG